MGSVLLCAGHRGVNVPFRLLHHAHRSTVLNCTSTGCRPVGLAGGSYGSGGNYTRYKLYLDALDVSHMSSIVTGVYSWNVIPERYTG